MTDCICWECNTLVCRAFAVQQKAFTSSRAGSGVLDDVDIRALKDRISIRLRQNMISVIPLVMGLGQHRM